MFNYPPELSQALKETGFDIVSTENNHSLDRYAKGIDKTLAKLHQADINTVGTRKKYSSKDLLKIIVTTQVPTLNRL